VASTNISLHLRIRRYVSCYSKDDHVLITNTNTCTKIHLPPITNMSFDTSMSRAPREVVREKPGPRRLYELLDDEPTRLLVDESGSKPWPDSSSSSSTSSSMIDLISDRYFTHVIESSGVMTISASPTKRDTTFNIVGRRSTDDWTHMSATSNTLSHSTFSSALKRSRGSMSARSLPSLCRI
jgi:hypothetical protein